MILKTIIKLFLFLFILVSPVWLNSQNIDKLRNELKNANGTEKAKIELELAQAYLNVDPSKTVDYATEAFNYGELNKEKQIAGNAAFLIAQGYYIQKSYSKALKYGEKSSEYLINEEDVNYYAVLELLGNISFDQKNYNRTISYLQDVYTYYEQINKHSDAGFVASKLGSSYEKLNKFEKATLWHKRAFQNFKEIESYREMIVTQSILGGIYSNYGDYNSALLSLNTAYDLAITHKYIDEFSTLEERLEIVKKNATSSDFSKTDFERDRIRRQKDTVNTILQQRAKTLEEIEKLSEEKQLVELKIRVQQDMYEKELLAERLQKIEIEEALKQEILAKENLALSLENEKLLSDKKSAENQKLFISLGALVLIIILVVLALLIKSRSNRKLASKNKEIERQKEEIEYKQESINQSILYATRIQDAILPSPDKMLEYFKDAFVYFNPKDQVSGDFLWTHEKNGKFYICVADCTGHGVPGAFMSIIFSNILEEIVKKEDVTDPGNVLDRTVTLLFNKVGGRSDALSSFKDGMDAVFLEVDLSNSKLKYSGAKNGLHLVRNGEIQEFKGIRRSVDISKPSGVMKTSFPTVEIPLAKEDIFYMFTDGYVDQKGGEENLKFYPGPFRDLLIRISQMNMAVQKEELNDLFEKWKGNNEQVDDVLVAGFKV